MFDLALLLLILYGSATI